MMTAKQVVEKALAAFERADLARADEAGTVADWMIAGALLLLVNELKRVNDRLDHIIEGTRDP